ncbi:MAG: type IX secretion system sortase PorU [Bacteroidales bacterium]|jgi:hypothetical protein|nr:type IX secretion system sortase PorU [Bacteroidales bacterium]
MSYRKAIKNFFCIIFTIIQIYIQGQDINQSYTLQWHQPYYGKISEDIVVSYLFFDNASLYQTNKQTPCFWKIFSVNENVVADITVTEQIWQSVTKEELDLIDVDLIRDSLYVNAYTEYTRKVPALKVEFFPFRKRGNQYEKLLSFRLQGNVRPVSTKIHKSRTYTTNSILNNDGFYKIGITKTGIHKITYDDFVQLGINVSSISTANIAVFGNGGRRLPEETSQPVFDDVQEVAIEVVDHNGNGIFEQSDYVLFYGVGIVHWDYSPSSTPSFVHDLNFYTNYAYYFINVHAGVGIKKRVSTIASSPSSVTHTVNSYYYYDVYEKELINVNGVGRIWFSEDYNYTTSHSYSFSVPGISKSQTLSLRMGLAIKSSANSTFLVNINNAVSFGNPFSASLDGYYREITYNNYTPTSDNININISYSKPVNSAIGWLDYIELHATRSLAQHTGMISFRNPEIIKVGNVANYQFETQGKNTQIWDVTDQHNVKRINAQRNGNTLSFTLEADSLREFVAFDGTEFNTVTTVGRVDRQNLHSYGGLDFIIITHPNFLEVAERLASFRRSNDNMRVGVVTTTQVYNEFGSGAGDIGAIRNFIKMFYDRESVNNIPKNVLLLGKTSYDPRNITETNSCLIPNYQGGNIFYKESCLSTDIFFTKLADGKGRSNMESMDMGIGRFPVLTALQAENLLQKSLNYSSYNDLTASSNNSYVSNLSNWRNIIAFAADDKDTYQHMNNTERVSEQIFGVYPYLNIEKIYCDALKKEASSGGARYPEATKAINARFNKGCLMFTYFGHGGDDGWSHERILMRSDISKWTNKYCLPFVYTACCTFARYDKIIGTSPAEDMLLKTDGGAIALITSTRNSGSDANENFGKRIHVRAFEQTNGAYLTMGEVHAKAHADVNGGGVEMYVFLGDPSATLAHPKLNVVTDSINAIAVNVYNDTIKALQFVTIKGHVTVNDNKPFNGWVYPTIYDKMDSVPVVNPLMSGDVKFPLQKSIIFKGQSKVENGYFSFSFMTPKDVNYEYGAGKISYYAMENGREDAKGYHQVLIGGMKDTVIDDKVGPDISLYFNDMKFVNGGLTSTTPVLYAKISDANGINTTGTGVGHDIVAVVDGDMSKSMILNDFFEYDTNSFVSGSLNYMLSPLKEGSHTLMLRAWDVVNNMNEETINFEVVKDEDLKIKHVLNYPNPFTTSTQFFFEHNRPNTLLHVRIQIFTISGKVVKTIIPDVPQINMGFRSDPIHWNGLDDFGDKLARGIYIYKLQVMTPDGKSTEKIEKIVIL